MLKTITTSGVARSSVSTNAELSFPLRDRNSAAQINTTSRLVFGLKAQCWSIEEMRKKNVVIRPCASFLSNIMPWVMREYFTIVANTHCALAAKMT